MFVCKTQPNQRPVLVTRGNQLPQPVCFPHSLVSIARGRGVGLWRWDVSRAGTYWQWQENLGKKVSSARRMLPSHSRGPLWSDWRVLASRGPPVTRSVSVLVNPRTGNTRGCRCEGCDGRAQRRPVTWQYVPLSCPSAASQNSGTRKKNVMQPGSRGWTVSLMSSSQPGQVCLCSHGGSTDLPYHGREDPHRNRFSPNSPCHPAARPHSVILSPRGQSPNSRRLASLMPLTKHRDFVSHKSCCITFIPCQRKRFYCLPIAQEKKNQHPTTYSFISIRLRAQNYLAW